MAPPWSFQGKEQLDHQAGWSQELSQNLSKVLMQIYPKYHYLGRNFKVGGLPAETGVLANALSSQRGRASHLPMLLTSHLLIPFPGEHWTSSGEVVGVGGEERRA